MLKSIFLLVTASLLTTNNTGWAQEKRVTAIIKRVFILGNSITRHAPAPKIGWYGDWGMAASSKDKDFVHILEAKFHEVSPSTTVYFENIAVFERTFWQYNFSKLDSVNALRPDLVILRIGENVKGETVEKYNFGLYCQKLIEYLKKNNTEVKILCVSSFWKTDSIDRIIEAASNSTNCHYLKISQLSEDSANMAIGQFEHEGVAKHPSDKGMATIAELIWKEVSLLAGLR